MEENKLREKATNRIVLTKLVVAFIEASLITWLWITIPKTQPYIIFVLVLFIGTQSALIDLLVLKDNQTKTIIKEFMSEVKLLLKLQNKIGKRPDEFAD